jgi:hypothetical protein
MKLSISMGAAVALVIAASAATSVGAQRYDDHEYGNRF